MDLKKFKTQFSILFTTLSLLRYIGYFDRLVNFIGGTVVLTTLAWNAAKFIRRFMNKELITSFKRAVVITGKKFDFIK